MWAYSQDTSLKRGKTLKNSSEPSWQEFEEEIHRILTLHGFDTSFRKVFRTSRRYEIDIVAERYGITLAIDCKRYGKHRYRLSHIKKEAEKHVKRCREFESHFGKKVIPLLVTFVEEDVILHDSCILVPYNKIEDFLRNLELYLQHLGFY